MTPSSSPRSWRETLVLLVLSAGICLTTLHLSVALAPSHPDNRTTFFQTDAVTGEALTLRQEWRPRVLALGAARLCRDLVARVETEPERHLRLTIGIYSAGWLFLANLLLLWCFPGRAHVFLWGVWAAVAFAYTPGAATRIYPWDLPPLFFFTAFVVCHARSADRMLLFVILLGSLFKETTGVLCLAILFRPRPLKTNLRDFALALGAFAALKAAVDLAVGNGVPLLSMTWRSSYTGEIRLFHNLTILTTPALAYPILINSGSFLAFLLLPGKDRTLLMLKCIAVAFALGLGLFGMLGERRLWLEMAPLAVYALDRHFGSGEERERRRTIERELEPPSAS